MQHRNDEQAPRRADPPDRAPPHDGLRERIGHAIGRWWTPAIAAIASVRQARMFHPTGHTFAGRIEPIIGGVFDALGARLDGRVLVRVSGALWKQEREWLDVLGVALRIRPGDGPPITERPGPRDQDLLFATIRSPLAMLIAPFTTDASNFLSSYWAVSPFEAPEVGRLELRLRPLGRAVIGGSRINRLREAVRRGEAGWWLDVRRPLGLGWHPVAVIHLEKETHVDQSALAFDPFRAGAELQPVGLVHAIRRAAYAASRRGRSQGSVVTTAM
ncbi:MAG: hypothetical protein IPQ07_02845 [Myxococcales bacterium]|nr:hypothetical protein [Myxococcales bacterium]